MGITIDYSVGNSLSEKNKAFEGVFQAPQDKRPQAVLSFIKAAENVLNTLKREGSAPSYALNAQDIKAQTSAILVTDRSNKEVRDTLKDFATRFGINLN